MPGRKAGEDLHHHHGRGPRVTAGVGFGPAEAERPVSVWSSSQVPELFDPLTGWGERCWTRVWSVADQSERLRGRFTFGPDQSVVQDGRPTWAVQICSTQTLQTALGPSKP